MQRQRDYHPPADKDSATVVMNLSDYTAKTDELLSDSGFYAFWLTRVGMH